MTIEMYDPSKFGLVTDVEKAIQGDKNWIKLPAGEFDVTPEKWEGSYRLIVNEDGTGALRILPSSKDSGITRSSQHSAQFMTGGITINLPQDQDVALLMEPTVSGIDAQGIIRYKPGKSPNVAVPGFLKKGRLRISEVAGQLYDEIQHPITNIDQAETLVISDAVRRATSLNWGHFGKGVEVGKMVMPFARLALRNAGMNFPINTLLDSKREDMEILGSIPDTRKREVGDGIWSVLLADEVSKEYAQFIRDWLYVKAPEGVAAFNRLNVYNVLDYFNSDPSFHRAGLRLVENLPKYRINS